MLRTAFFAATFVPWTLLVILAALVASPLGPDTLHRLGRLWSRIGLLLAGGRLEVTGTAHLPRDRPVVLMANHQSNFDTLALMTAVPLSYRWLAKKELFRIPLFGWAMRCAGCVVINRADREAAIASMQKAARQVTAGTSVIVFPEGTRSPHGHLLPFKKGGFLLAIESGAPIIPIAVDGGRRIMPKHTLSVRSGTMRVAILPPLPTAGLDFADRDDLMNRVRGRLATALHEETDRH